MGLMMMMILCYHVRQTGNLCRLVMSRYSVHGSDGGADCRVELLACVESLEALKGVLLVGELPRYVFLLEIQGFR